MLEIKDKMERFPCRLLTLQSREWKSNGQGEVNLEQTEGLSYAFFSNEDGSELCWKIDPGKRFQWDSGQKVKFYCDVEQIFRAFDFENQEIAKEFWSSLQLALRLETEGENVGSFEARFCEAHHLPR